MGVCDCDQVATNVRGWLENMISVDPCAVSKGFRSGCGIELTLHANLLIGLVGSSDVACVELQEKSLMGLECTGAARVQIDPIDLVVVEEHGEHLEIAHALCIGPAETIDCRTLLRQKC